MFEFLLVAGPLLTLFYLLLIFMIPIFLYSAQKWAYKNNEELVRANRLLVQIRDKLSGAGEGG